MYKLKWSGEDSTMVRSTPHGEKFEVQPGEVFEVETELQAKHYITYNNSFSLVEGELSVKGDSTDVEKLTQKVAKLESELADCKAELEHIQKELAEKTEELETLVAELEEGGETPSEPETETEEETPSKEPKAPEKGKKKK